MIGVVIVTHGGLAEQLLVTATNIVGQVKQAKTLSITVGEDVDHIRENLSNAIQSVDTGNGVLILTDMFGGTPSNISLSFLHEKKVEVITGVNLPMLVKVLTMQDNGDLFALAKQIEVYGKKNIYLASEILKSRSKKGSGKS